MKVESAYDKFKVEIEEKSLSLFGVLNTYVGTEMEKENENSGSMPLNELENENSYKMLRAYVEGSSNMVYLKDSSLRYVAANKNYSSFFGLKSEDLMGKTDAEILPVEYATCQLTDLDAIDTNEHIVKIEMIKNRYFEARKFPVPLVNGEIGVGGIIKDITTERNQQIRLSAVSERNRIIAECMLRRFNDKQERLDYVLNEAIKLTESLYGYIYLYDADNMVFSISSWSREAMSACSVVEKYSAYPLEHTGLWGEVVRQNRPIIENNFEMPNLLKKGYPEGHVKIKRFMSIPVIIDDRIVAVVGMANKEAEYTYDDVSELTILINGAWLAIEIVDEQKKTKALLEQTQSMFDNHDAVMLLIDPETGKIINANPSASAFYGYSHEELTSMYIHQINMLDSVVIDDSMQKAFKKTQKYNTFPHKKKDGELRYVDVYSTPIKYGSRNVLYSIIFDVTDREKAYKDIAYIGHHDYLTGLYNRRYFETALRELDIPDNLPICVVMADVNGLKTINDIYGHKVGDKLLIKASQLFKDFCIDECVAARIGGDEFALIIPKCGKEKASEILERLQKNCRENYQQDTPLTMAMGFKIKSHPEEDVQEALKDAEAFMYRRKMHESSSLRNLSTELVMNALFAKSEREMEHSSRVSVIAEKIAGWLGLSEVESSEIRVAALLHDIGKIGIPEDVLNKQGRLTPEERKTIERHPEIGWRILGSNDEYKEIAKFILHHHEQWDGKGYPNGLKGEEISLQSRIIGVADAFDAMTKHRSYKFAFTEEQAIEELKKCSGRQFDPHIIEVFLNNCDNL